MVKQLLLEQAFNISEFERFWRNVKACSTANCTLGYLHGRVEELNRLWTEFFSLHKQIMLKTGYKATEDDYFSKDCYNAWEQKVFMWKGVLLDKIRKLEEESRPLSQEGTGVLPVIATPSSSPARMSEEVKLPRITLPKFSGKYTEWTAFHDLFISIVHSSKLPNVQKLHYLKTSLTGEAELLLRHFSVTDANYSPAWEYLCRRYENKRLLISTQLNVFISQANILNDTSQAIKRLLDTSLEALESIKALGVDIASWDPIIVHIITQKLPAETHQLWEQARGSSTELPTFKELQEYLESRFRILEATADKQKGSKDSRPRHTPQNHQTFQSYHNAVLCRMCRTGSHSIRQCTQFLKQTPKMRFESIKKNKCCINCLAQSHTLKECNSTQTCFTCNKRHHTLLHFAAKSNMTSTQPTTSANYIAQATAPDAKKAPVTPPTQQHSKPLSAIPQPAPTNVQIYHTGSNKQILLATALIFAIHNKSQIVLRALIDPGSQASFITESACQMLSLPKLDTLASVTGLGKTPTATSKSMVRLTIASRITPFTMVIEAITLPTLTNQLPSHKVADYLPEPLQDIMLADPNFNCPGTIDVILGADVYPHILLEGLKRGTEGTPIAQNTQLGWILSGSAPNTSATHHTIQSFFNKLELETLLQRFWEIEELAHTQNLTADEALCEEFFQQNSIRTESGRYMVRLPFHPNTTPDQLGNSRSLACRRLLSLKHKFQRDPELYQTYKAAIEEYISLGQLKRIPFTQLNEPNFYLPHHAVFKDTGTSKKLRVVFDASAKSSSGKSLNDLLLVGPPLQQNIVDIILRFRKYAVVFAADIEKMYPQILMHPKDADYQRILWFDSLDGPIYDLKFEVVVFGVSSSPYLAIRTLKRLAQDEKEKFPKAAEIIETDSYVDDILSGGDTLEEATDAQIQLIQLLKSAGFKLKKWASNEPALLKEIPPSDRLMKDTLELASDHTIKTLGITWNPIRDEFTFRINFQPSKSQNTKRSVLSATAKLYDPLGWVAPVIIVAKIFMQTLWLAGLNWDDPLPTDLNEQWNNYASKLKELERIKIPRFIKYNKVVSCQIHGFSDASEKAYAAVVYIRTIDDEGTISVHMVAAKTRVAPVKTVSLPRLELCGALLLTRLLLDVKRAMNLHTVPMCAWTDSSIVLTWLHAHPNKWKCFVANRVSEIISRIPPSDWKHVSTHDNPADLASRGVNPDQLPNCTQWWNGPSWLSLPEKEWPNPKFTPDSSPDSHGELEARKIQAFVSATTELHEGRLKFLTRFSSLQRLLSATAYWQRFIHNCRVRSSRRAHPDFKLSDMVRTGPLAPEELSSALNFWIQFIQISEFPEEIAGLKLKRDIRSSSKIKSLTPVLDENGLLRVGGRLEHTQSSYDQKHPIILPHSSHLTALIIQDKHANTLHGGIQLTLNMLRKRYWIVKARSAVKSCIHRCIICIRQKGQTSRQLMAHLPTNRVNISRPFTNTGVDYAGPIAVRMSKGRGCRTYKGYIAIFVCFATRAIHLEVVSDLTSEAFLAALKRFIARRGLCANLYSDCGTNFVGANSTLEKDYYAALNSNSTLASLLAKDGIKWHFNPPGAPHFGGLWEAGVKSMKHHLRRVMGNSTLTYEELSTLVTQIEACLNSRPLHPLSDDPSDLNAITPGHFLIGDALLAPPEPALENANISSLKRWQLLQRLRQEFWRRWRDEYLSRLQQRPKWLTKINNIAEGDLVLIKDENMPPMKWAMGRVLQTHPGKDSLVRVATLKTQTGTMTRPVAKLCALPLKETSLEPSDSNSNQEIDAINPDHPTPNIVVSAESLDQLEPDGEVKSVEVPKAPSRTTRNRRNRIGLSSLYNVLLTCFMVFSLFTGGLCTHSVKYPEPGLYIEHLGETQIRRGILRLEICNKAQLQSDSQRVRDSVSAMDRICTRAKQFTADTHCDMFVQHLREKEANLLETIDVLKGRTLMRKKRGLFGKILQSVFGVNDEVYRDIKDLDSNQKHLIQSLGDQHVLMLSMSHHLNVSENRLTDRVNTLTAKINKVTATLNDMEPWDAAIDANRINIHVFAAYHTALNLYGDLTDSYDNLVKGLLGHGSVSDFITPSHLTAVIQHASQKLPTHLEVRRKNTEHVEVKMNDSLICAYDYLDIIERLHFKLAKITSIPRKVKNSTYLVPVIPTNVIAVDFDSQKYFELTETEFGKCDQLESMLYLCAPTVIGNIETNSNCAIDALLQREEKMPCKFKEVILPTTLWKRLMMANTWLFVLNTPLAAAIRCNRTREEVTLRGVGIVNIDRGCTLQTPKNLLQSNFYDVIPVKATHTHALNYSIPELQPIILKSKHTIEAEPVLSPMDNFENASQPESPALFWATIGHHAASSGIAVLCTLLLVALIFHRRVWFKWLPGKTPSQDRVNTALSPNTPELGEGYATIAAIHRRPVAVSRSFLPRPPTDSPEIERTGGNSIPLSELTTNRT